MNHILAVYDIAESLKIKNPSPEFRKYGVRINLSCWVFPGHAVPHDAIEKLRGQGAEVHLVEFAEQAQEKILELARTELRKHLRKMIQFVEKRCEKCQNSLASASVYGIEVGLESPMYRKWRSVISKARRELIASEQCAMSFGLASDVNEGINALENLLSAELGAALAWKAAQKEKPKEMVA